MNFSMSVSLADLVQFAVLVNIMVVIRDLRKMPDFTADYGFTGIVVAYLINLPLTMFYFLGGLFFLWLSKKLSELIMYLFSIGGVM